MDDGNLPYAILAGENDDNYDVENAEDKVDVQNCIYGMSIKVTV